MSVPTCPCVLLQPLCLLERTSSGIELHKTADLFISRANLVCIASSTESSAGGKHLIAAAGGSHTQVPTLPEGSSTTRTMPEELSISVYRAFSRRLRTSIASLPLAFSRLWLTLLLYSPKDALVRALEHGPAQDCKHKSIDPLFKLDIANNKSHTTKVALYPVKT